MSEMEKKQAIYDRYIQSTHTIGRICTLITLILLLAAPFVIGIYLGAMPNMAAGSAMFPCWEQEAVTWHLSPEI